MAYEFTSVYPYSRTEAERRNESRLWDESFRANVQCSRDIEATIRSDTKADRLKPGCAERVLEVYGFKLLESTPVRSADPVVHYVSSTDRGISRFRSRLLTLCRLRETALCAETREKTDFPRAQRVLPRPNQWSAKNTERLVAERSRRCGDCSRTARSGRAGQCFAPCGDEG